MIPASCARLLSVCDKFELEAVSSAFLVSNPNERNSSASFSSPPPCFTRELAKERLSNSARCCRGGEGVWVVVLENTRARVIATRTISISAMMAQWRIDQRGGSTQAEVARRAAGAGAGRAAELVLVLTAGAQSAWFPALPCACSTTHQQIDGSLFPTPCISKRLSNCVCAHIPVATHLLWCTNEKQRSLLLMLVKSKLCGLGASQVVYWSQGGKTRK